jgi:hypothetical protein
MHCTLLCNTPATPEHQLEARLTQPQLEVEEGHLWRWLMSVKFAGIALAA